MRSLFGLFVAAAVVQCSRNRLQELNELPAERPSRSDRRRIESVTVEKEKQAELQPRVFLHPVSHSSPGNALMSEKPQPKDLIVSSDLGNLMLGAVIQPPLPGATHPPRTTRNPLDGTDAPTTTPFAIHDVRPAPKAASFKNALFGGATHNSQILRGDWIKREDSEEDESEEKPKKHSHKKSEKLPKESHVSTTFHTTA
ncbi:unnamed protein product, partial [Mesorhabditis spiculigera]